MHLVDYHRLLTEFDTVLAELIEFTEVQISAENLEKVGGQAGSEGE